MDRFMIPQTVKTFLNVAVETKVADHLDLVALASTFPGEWSTIMTEVVQWAFNNRHSPSGQAAHAALCAAHDAAVAARPRVENFTLTPVR